jgi:hypothetical protein
MSLSVRVEVFSLRDFHTIRSLEVVASHDIVDIVDSSGSHPNLGEISGPNTTVGILGLILREVRRVDVVMNVAASYQTYRSLSSHS